jgi:hypothetical protein
MSKLSIGLGIALGLSVLANTGAGYVYLQQRDALTAAANNLEHAAGDTAIARAAADACSASVESLAASAAVMASQLEAARADAAQRAGRHYTKADKILATPAAVPGDACASAQKRVADLLAKRDQKGGG